MLASVRTQTPESNHVDRLRRQLTEATPGKEGEAYLSYGLHKELHDIGDYAGAWAALERGCRVKRTHVDYAPDEEAAMVDQAIATFDADFLRDMSQVEQPSVPIFILGMHRSGTTLLEHAVEGGDIWTGGRSAGATGASWCAGMSARPNAAVAPRLQWRARRSTVPRT